MLLFELSRDSVSLYLWYKAVQLSDSVPVRWVCGQPLGESGLSCQLVSNFHLLPENRARAHICTCLGRIHTYPMESEKQTQCGIPPSCTEMKILSKLGLFSLTTVPPSALQTDYRDQE